MGNLLQQVAKILFLMHQVVKSRSLECVGVLVVVMSKFSDEKIEGIILNVAGLNSNRIENDHPFCQSMMKHEPNHMSNDIVYMEVLCLVMLENEVASNNVFGQMSYTENIIASFVE